VRGGGEEQGERNARRKNIWAVVADAPLAGAHVHVAKENIHQRRISCGAGHGKRPRVAAVNRARRLRWQRLPPHTIGIRRRRKRKGRRARRHRRVHPRAGGSKAVDHRRPVALKHHMVPEYVREKGWRGRVLRARSKRHLQCRKKRKPELRHCTARWVTT